MQEILKSRVCQKDLPTISTSDHAGHRNMISERNVNDNSELHTYLTQNKLIKMTPRLQRPASQS